MICVQVVLFHHKKDKAWVRNTSCFPPQIYLVKVIVKQGAHTTNNFEASSLNDYKEFLKQYSGELSGGSYNIIYFKCTNIIINPDTKRVCSVTFEQL